MQFITEVSIVVLMVGTLVGGIAQIGEAGSTAILYFNADASGPTLNGSGRILMVIFVVAVVAPLCTLKNMRKVSQTFCCPWLCALLCCPVLCCPALHCAVLCWRHAVLLCPGARLSVLCHATSCQSFVCCPASS